MLCCLAVDSTSISLQTKLTSTTCCQMLFYPCNPIVPIATRLFCYNMGSAPSTAFGVHCVIVLATSWRPCQSATSVSQLCTSNPSLPDGTGSSVMLCCLAVESTSISLQTKLTNTTCCQRLFYPCNPIVSIATTVLCYNLGSAP